MLNVITGEKAIQKGNDVAEYYAAKTINLEELTFNSDSDRNRKLYSFRTADQKWQTGFEFFIFCEEPKSTKDVLHLFKTINDNVGCGNRYRIVDIEDEMVFGWLYNESWNQNLYIPQLLTIDQLSRIFGFNEI